MKVTHTAGLYLIEASVDENARVEAVGGCRWDRERRCWTTRDWRAAAQLAPYCDPAAAAAIRAGQLNAQASEQASRATASAVEIPAPAGLRYLPFQRAGIAYALPKPHVLIGDEMGLGKTIQAIGIINADPAVTSVLVICPASLKLNWARELTRWLVRPLRIRVANGRLAPEAADVWILNYGVLKKHREALRDREWDLLVADEVHYAKNTKAQRTVELFGGVIHHPETETTPALRETVTPIPARRRVYLTGTPILNRPIELWPLLHSADPQGLGRNWRDYVTRYCAGHQEAVLIGRRRTKLVWNVTGASHLDDLQARLRSTLMVRRLKHDVLTELPAKRRQILELPAEAAAGEVAGELAAWRAQQDRLATLHAAAECAQRGDDPAAYRAAVAALRAGLTVAFAEMSVQRHATALAKVPLILEHVREAAEQSGKVVCFCHHKDVVAALQGCLAAAGVRCVCCTGDMGLAERQAAVDAFQQDPLVRVFLGTIMAAGVGLTLTASSHVIFAELDWVPGNMSQAEDRCHRIGQRGSVLVQHLVLEGSLDAEIARRLVEKQDLIDQALDHVGAAPPDPGRGMWGRLLDIVAPAAGPAEVSA